MHDRLVIEGRVLTTFGKDSRRRAGTGECW